MEQRDEATHKQISPLIPNQDTIEGIGGGDFFLSRAAQRKCIQGVSN